MQGKTVQRKIIPRHDYYNDGITRVTDAFWTVQCPDCGQTNWNLTFDFFCPHCKSPNAVYTNPTIKQ